MGARGKAGSPFDEKGSRLPPGCARQRGRAPAVLVKLAIGHGLPFGVEGSAFGQGQAADDQFGQGTIAGGGWRAVEDAAERLQEGGVVKAGVPGHGVVVAVVECVKARPENSAQAHHTGKARGIQGVAAQAGSSELAQGGNFRVHGAVAAGQHGVVGHGSHTACGIGNQRAERPALMRAHSLPGGFDGGKHVRLVRIHGDGVLHCSSPSRATGMAGRLRPDGASGV